MIRNHPGEELLSSYSAGSLPLGQGLCVAAHIEFCGSCCQNLQRLDKVGGELLQQLNPAKVSCDVKNAVLKEIDERLDSIESDDHDVAYYGDSSIPVCLRQFVKTSYQNLSWQRVARSIHNIELFRDGESAKIELLKIKPSGSATTHSHLGDEYTVILEGSFSDEDGLYQQGDFLIRNSHHVHTPVATRDKDCICLAVSEAPLQFTGFFNRLLNPLIRRGYSQN